MSCRTSTGPERPKSSRHPRPFLAALLLAAAGVASAQEVESEAFVPRPVAGHPVFDMRVGVDRVDAHHPVICAEISPLAWLSVEGCGTGSGFLHHGTEPDMAHFRSRARLLSHEQGRTEIGLLVGAGFAEIQRSTDRAGFKFGKATEAQPIEAAGPEASAGLKGRLWLDNGGRTYMSGDLTGGAAVIPAAPDVIGRGGPVVPFAAMSVGLGF